MFQVGDAVLYRQDGVCRIEDRQSLNLTGEGEREYFLLKPLYRKGMTVYVEAEDAGSMLRKPLNEEEINALIEELPGLASDWISPDKERAGAIASALSGGDIRQMLSSTRMLYRRKASVNRSGKKFNSQDENSFRRLEDIICRELAYGLHIKPEEVPTYIQERLQGA